MAHVLKLVCGNRTLNLLGDWKLRTGGGGFAAPKGNVVYSGASPWSEGASRTSSFANNREIALTCSLQSMRSPSNFSKAMADMHAFFQDAKQNQEGGARDAVYLVRALDEGYTGSVQFGRGPLYHKVLAGHLDIPADAYGVYLLAHTMLESTLTLTCEPYGVGKPTFLAEATGWERFDDDGALHIWEGTTNLLLNPSFEHATFSTDWAVSDASLVAAVEYERVHQARDMITFQAARLNNTAAVVRQYTSTKTLTAATYALSCYVYTDGSAVSVADCQLYGSVAGGSAVIATTFTADPDNAGWYRLTGTYTADAVARAVGLEVKATKTAIADDFQLELKAVCTPFALGDQGPGLAFSGTAHNSTTVRTAGQWRVRTKWDPHPGYEVLYYGKGALSVWVKSEWAGNDGVAHIILDTAVTDASIGQIQLSKSSGNLLVVNVYGSTAGGLRQFSYAVDASTWAINTWHHVVLTWDKTGPLELWLDGLMVDNVVASAGTWTNLSAVGTYVYLGSNTAGAGVFNGYIGDVRIFGPDFAWDSGKTPNDLYASGYGRGKSELGLLWTSAIGGAVQSTSDSANKNYFYVAGVPGDVDAPTITLAHNDGGSWSFFYLALHKNATFPYAMNVQESVGYYYPVPGGSATQADAARSGGGYERMAASTVFNEAYTILESPRVGPLIAGRYHILAIVRDGAAATGLTTWRGSIAQSTAGNVLATLSEHAARVNDIVYADRIALWTVVDLGVFSLPLLASQQTFPGQKQQGEVATTAYYLSFFPFGATSAAANLDVDYFVFMPHDHLVSVSARANYVTVMDMLSGGLSWLAKETAGSAITMEPSDDMSYNSTPWQGAPITLTPRKWVFGNVLCQRASTASQTPADAVKLYVIYQPRYLWGR